MLMWTARAIVAITLAILATMLGIAAVATTMLAIAATMLAVGAFRSMRRAWPRRPARSGEGAASNQGRVVEPAVEPALSHPLSLARGSPGRPAWLTKAGQQMGCDITVTSQAACSVARVLGPASEPHGSRLASTDRRPRGCQTHPHVDGRAVAGQGELTRNLAEQVCHLAVLGEE